TDANFRRPSSDGVGGYAVESERGEQQRQRAEERRESRDQAFFGEAGIDLLLESLELDDRKVGIDARERTASNLLHVVYRPAGLHDDGASIHGQVLLRWGVRVHRALRQRNKVHGVVLPVHTAVRRVLDHTHDLIGAIFAGSRETEAVADGVACAKKLLNELL